MSHNAPGQEWSHLLQVEEAKRKRDGRPWPAAEKAAFSDKLRQKYLAEATATYSSARLWCVCIHWARESCDRQCRMILHCKVVSINRLSPTQGRRHHRSGRHPQSARAGPRSGHAAQTNPYTLRRVQVLRRMGADQRPCRATCGLPQTSSNKTGGRLAPAMTPYFEFGTTGRPQWNAGPTAQSPL